MVKVWDPLVRIFHWSLVVLFGIAWVTPEVFDNAHEWVGYGVAALVGVRLLWGLVGTRYARFTNFVKSPGSIIGYLRTMVTGSGKGSLGHNPAACAMIVALLVTLLITVLTGWMQTLPQYHHVAWVKGSHDAITSVLMILIVAHILGVFIASRHHDENLAKSMVNGKKRKADGDDIA